MKAMEVDEVSRVDETVGFVCLNECFAHQSVWNTLRSFTMAQIIGYFIEAIATDNDRTQDFKSLRESSFQMFKDGHVQKIAVKMGYETLILRCDCLPEMRKDRVYKIMLRLHHATGDVQFAKCGCVAGKGPRATCKHVAAVCYALEDFSRRFLSNGEDFSCTDELQKWNQPRKKRLSPRKISELDFAVESHAKTKRKMKLQGREPKEIVGIVTETDFTAVCELKTKLETFQHDHPLRKLSILSVLHSSNPVCNFQEAVSSNTITGGSRDIHEAHVPLGPSVMEQRVMFKENLKKSEEERAKIFVETQMQSECPSWFEERKCRITGSICGKIINRNRNIYPASLIKLVTRRSPITTAAMKMGKQQEPQILARYLHHQRQNGYPELTVNEAGFLIDSVHGWLGASPDAVVNDGVEKGCVEVKAAVSFWDKNISDAASSGGSFFLQQSNETGSLYLKRKHAYYHQCQLQLFVGRDMFQWCDFVVATEKDLFIERISVDEDWVATNLNGLECFYDSFILPKLII